MKEISLLDHGYVRLVDHMGDDLSIVRAARVSYDADWRAGEDAGKDEKLINYLVKNRHTSPLESVQFTFEIKAPIFVMRQWMRHRTWKYNEISARYAELPEEFYVPEVQDITKQSVANKQQRTDEQLPPEQAAFIRAMIYQQNKEAFITYHMLLKNGCPRELARGVLPVNTYTKVYATVDLHNLLHFINLRDHPHAQQEIRVYAKAMLELIEPIVPMAIKAYINKEKANGREHKETEEPQLATGTMG
jgi:thymidylate synthase (FAD)